MTETLQASSDVDSPCNNICTLNAAEVCIGCGRSLKEVAIWSQALPQQKRLIVAAAARRLAELSVPGPRGST